MAITIVIITISLIVGTGVMFYSKVTHKDETQIEKTIETVIEKQLEGALNLPDDSLKGKIDFMVRPIDQEDDKNKL
jgi:hypothetical protein